MCEAVALGARLGFVGAALDQAVGRVGWYRGRRRPLAPDAMMDCFGYSQKNNAVMHTFKIVFSEVSILMGIFTKTLTKDTKIVLHSPKLHV